MGLPFSLYLSAGALLVGAFAGWTIRDWKCDAATLVAVEKGERQESKMVDAVNLASARYEEFRNRQDTSTIEQHNTIREIYKNVEVPANCAANPDAVRVLESVRQRANASASGELEKPVSAATPATQPTN